jgi:tetratricopeptide (TPR) repeat protein
MAKVYVSSTIIDLKSERHAVLEWLRLARHQAVDSYLPDSDAVRDSCLDDVAACDLYVLILGHRYGFQPSDDNPEGLSITHLEFRRAGECVIPRVALLRTSIPDVRLSDLQDPARVPLVLAFRAEVADRVRMVEFSDLKALIQGLSTGIQGELEKRDRRIRATERASADQAARAELDRVSGPAVIPSPGQARGGAAFWLRPDQRVVGFIDRPELARLRQWCAGQDVPEVMLLTGAGGVGKTRLALRLAEEQQEQGWLCRVVRAGREADVVAAAHAVTRGPVLLIVDYAETRPGLGGLLAEVADNAGDLLRVLLVARGVGEWWAQLEASADADLRMLIASAGRVPVGTLKDNAHDSAELVRSAVREFARVLRVAVPGPVQVTLPERAVPILVLHAAALLAVLDMRDSAVARSIRVVADEQVLAGLLAREKAFWLGSAQTAGLSGPGGVDSVTAAQAVAVACLITVADENDAAQTLRRVPGLADVPLGTLLRIARWLRQLYPADEIEPSGGKARWWGCLQPDLVAEQHVTSVLADAPGLARECLRDLTVVQALGALTMLARACAHQIQAPGIISAALRANPTGLGLPAVQVAVQTAGKLGEIFTDVLGDLEASGETLIAIYNAIPDQTIILATAAADLAQRITASLPANSASADRGSWLISLGVRLSKLGRWPEALAVTQEAVAIYRELVAASLDQYRPDLALSLTNLGQWFWALDRSAEALPVTEEAVGLYRELATAYPSRYRADLARSLANLGVLFSDLDRSAEALPVTQEAVAIRRELAAVSPDQYRPDLALSLINLGIRYVQLGRLDEAVLVIQEAVTIRRELATASPDQYRPDLAGSLTNLGALFTELGRPAEALPVTQEAVAIRRELATAYPSRYRADLARSLANLGELFCNLGRPAKALPVTQEAVTIRRELATPLSGRYRADLARSLANLGELLTELGNPGEALPVTQEAVTIRRELATANPSRHRLDLATSLNHLADIFDQLDLATDAEAARRESRKIQPST